MPRLRKDCLRPGIPLKPKPEIDQDSVFDEPETIFRLLKYKDKTLHFPGFFFGKPKVYPDFCGPYKERCPSG